MIRQGFEVLSFEGFGSAFETINNEDISVVITDLSMPDHSGLDVLKHCKEFSPDLPVILVTAFGTIEAAVMALKNGAFDFILKPFDQDELIRNVQKAIETRKRKNREPGMEIFDANGIGPVPVPLFGIEPSTQLLREQVARISSSRSNVFIYGEVGSGKRSVAHEIHRKSDRSNGPFVQVQCDAIPDIFQIGELFGMEKGPNPISYFSKPGAFELGMTGTILLDEVDALGKDSQNALFSALESEFFSRAHGAKRFPTDFRLIASSSKDITPLLNKGQFHEELYHLLSLEKIDLKPLRYRKKDIQTHLLPYFLQKSCRKRGIPSVTFDDSVENWFMSHHWKGNIGELERTVEKIVNLWVSGPITSDLLIRSGLL